MKLGCLYAGTDHLSQIETGEEPTNIEDGFPDVQLFRFDMVDDYYEQIIQFLVMGVAPEEITTSQNKHLVVKATDFHLIAGQIYKIGPDAILRQCALPREQGQVLVEAHAGVTGGHYGGRVTVRKVLRAGLWWPTLHSNAIDYA